MPTAIGLQHWCSVTDFSISKHKPIKSYRLYTLLSLLLRLLLPAHRVLQMSLGAIEHLAKPPQNGTFCHSTTSHVKEPLTQQGVGDISTQVRGSCPTWWRGDTSAVSCLWRAMELCLHFSHGPWPRDGWVGQNLGISTPWSNCAIFPLNICKDLSHCHVPQTSEAASSNSLWCHLQFSVLFFGCRQFGPFLLYIFSMVYCMQRY